MQRRAGMIFATTALISIVLAACRTRTASVEDDKKAAINVVLAHEQAVQAYDFDKVDSLHTPDARVIEESYPHPFEPDERQGWQVYKDAGLHVDYHAQDVVAEVRAMSHGSPGRCTAPGQPILRRAGPCWEGARGVGPGWRVSFW